MGWSQDCPGMVPGTRLGIFGNVLGLFIDDKTREYRTIREYLGLSGNVLGLSQDENETRFGTIWEYSGNIWDYAEWS